MGQLLTAFFRFVEHAPPTTGIECNNLVRPTDFALEDFKRDYPGEFPRVVEALGTAMIDYNHSCRALGGGGVYPATWRRAAEHVYRAEELFTQALGKTPKPPATPEDRESIAADHAPEEETPPATVPEDEKESADEPAPAEPGDTETVEKASNILYLVQKLASALDLGVDRKKVEDHLIDAHASLEDFFCPAPQPKRSIDCRESPRGHRLFAARPGQQRCFRDALGQGLLATGARVPEELRGHRPGAGWRTVASALESSPPPG
ncbi:hypothetical protein MYX77_10850 [Acidobacteriia bacterium AH_259_A11_L15]|nr:hypothetical protein [Acidobacteriia bacterium AH_259_A11_L15]